MRRHAEFERGTIIDFRHCRCAAKMVQDYAIVLWVDSLGAFAKREDR